MMQQPQPPPFPRPEERKRPLYPSDKPLPRAIQPRPPGPPASTASYGSESGSSAQLSPRLPIGEPPRKRGRPSKAETERRKLLAEARGEPYPAPRRRRISPPSPAPTSFPFAKPAPYEREIPRNMMRELPRPNEMGPLPSPHALQLGPPDAFPRAGERAFGFFDERREGREIEDKSLSLNPNPNPNPNSNLNPPRDR